nr:heterodisulfide reductase subunit B [Actinomycetota bacterium]
MSDAVSVILSKKTNFEREPDRRSADFHEELFALEAAGELIVQRVSDDFVSVPTKYGIQKKIQRGHLWHHKSCGQCGNIPGYPASLLWTMNQLGMVPGIDYLDETDQTSCTAWNYH